MYKYDHSKQFTNTARAAVAFCALAALGSGAAFAQATAVTDPNQLVNTVRTMQYPSGNSSAVVPSSFTVGLEGGNTNQLTFTATNAVSGSGFNSFTVSTANAAPQFTMAPFGEAGDTLVNTTFAGANGNLATGPLRIDFQQGVTGFGLLAQDFNLDTETFTLDVFNGAAQIGTFTFGPTDNSVGTGEAVFLGAQANMGNLITSATISSLSVAVGQQPNNGNNDFAIGRTLVEAPVPEASTMISFGMGVLLFGCFILVARKRKAGMAPNASSQTAG